MSRYWPSLLAFVIGCAAAAVGYVTIPPRCVSRATLRVTTALPERYVPGAMPLSAQRVVERALDRRGAADMVLHHELYPGVRKRRSLTAALDQFQRALRVEVTPEDLIRIEFTHDDPEKVLIVVKEAVDRLVDQSIRDATLDYAVPGLLSDQAESTLAAWKNCRASGGAGERARVDCDAVRVRYLALRHRAYEFELLQEMRRWGFASRLQVLDPATPAVRSDRMRQWTAAGCALAGIVAAVVLFFLRRS